MTDACHICASPLADATVIAERARHGHRARRVVCSACGLVQVSPQPSANELATYTHEPDPYRLRGCDVVPGTPEHDSITETLDAQRGARIAMTFGIGTGVIDVSDLDVAAMVNPHDGPVARNAVVISALQRWADPVGALRRLRTLGVTAIYVEVPDVDAYGGDIEAHYRREHLYDFSAITLLSVLQLAGFGGLQVVAHDGKLIAWSRADAGPYVCDDPDARVRHLTAAPIETAPPAEMTTIDRFLNGEDVDIPILRAELTTLRGPYAAMLAAWDDAHRTLGSLQDAWSRAMRAHVEASVTDAWLAGASFGKGVAYDQAAKAVSHVLHRMGRLSGAYR